MVSNEISIGRRLHSNAQRQMMEMLLVRLHLSSYKNKWIFSRNNNKQQLPDGGRNPNNLMFTKDWERRHCSIIQPKDNACGNAIL